MANDLTLLVEALQVQLRDTTSATWAVTEMESLINWSVRALWPRYSRPILPTSAQITLTTATYFYALPAGVRAISRIDILDTTSVSRGTLFGGAWEIVGDVNTGAGQLHVGNSVVDGSVGYTLRLTGYGTYDVYDYNPPDELVPLILARARAEAYRRLAGDREKFKVWLSRNQTQNVSVNEALDIVGEADGDVARLERVTPRTWQLPVQGRLG